VRAFLCPTGRFGLVAAGTLFEQPTTGGFDVATSRSRSSAWVFFEFVNCAVADEGLKSSLRSSWNLLNTISICQQDEISMQVVQVLTTCMFKAAVMAWFRSQVASVCPPGVSGSVSGKIQEPLRLGHSFSPFSPCFWALPDTLCPGKRNPERVHGLSHHRVREHGIEPSGRIQEHMLFQAQKLKPFGSSAHLVFLLVQGSAWPYRHTKPCTTFVVHKCVLVVDALGACQPFHSRLYRKRHSAQRRSHQRPRQPV
jgi:hypothetical protein